MASASPAEPQKQAIIFESYAWNDAQEIAKRLTRDLEGRGFSVWLDVDKMRNPERWSMEIVQAIDHADVVLALLSPQAVRTAGAPESADGQDSVCHYELQHARLRKKPIVPVLVLACSAPPLLGALPLDWSDWHRSEASYREGLERIVRTLSQVSEGKPSAYSRFIDLLEPIDFYLPLARHRQAFCGRDWIFTEVERWLEGASRCLLVVGEPGIGKSALVAELVFRNPGQRIIAHFVIDRSIGATLQPKTFVRTIAALIAGQVPAYRAAIEAGDVGRWLLRDRCATDPLGGFLQGVLRPLREIPAPEGGPRVIVVDALDEGLRHAESGPGGGAVTIPDLLAASLADLPPWLRILATTRPDSRVLPLFGGARRFEIDARDPQQRRDLEAYVARRLAQDPLKKLLTAEGRDPERVAGEINERSCGSFLYAQLALDGLAEGTLAIDALARLPPGLASLYHDLFRRLFASAADYAPAATILEALIASRDGLTETELAAVTRLDVFKDLRPTLAGLSPYLANVDHTYRPDVEPRHRIYHKSLADWLGSPPADHRDFRLDRARGERALLAYCRAWAELKHQYQLVNRVPHLVAAGALDEAAGALAGEFPDVRARLLGTRSYDLDDMATLAAALFAAKRGEDALRYAATSNPWFRDGVTAALQALAERDQVDAAVGRLLHLKAGKPKEPSQEIVNARLVGVRVAAARGLGDRLVEASADRASAVRFLVVPELYRFWRQQGEAGWILVQRMADRAVSRLGLPSPETIETLGHLSLAILHEHRERPEDMARLLAIWRALANRLVSTPLFRLAGRRWVLSLLTSPLARLLQRQPDYQPLNLRELAVTFAKPVAERGAWTVVSDCLGRDDASVEPVVAILLDKALPFDLFLMLSAERTLIAKGGYDLRRVFDAAERLFREGCPWFRQSALYVLFHLLRRAPEVELDMLERYAGLTMDFVARDGASMTTAVKTYGFAPHLAWPEIVFARHDRRLQPRFLPGFLRKAHASGDTGFVTRVFKAIDLLSFAYGEHELALGAVDAALALKDPALEPLILASLANIRLQDQSAVEAFLLERDLDELAPRVAALAPTIRAEDIPTWIDDFVVQWMLTSKWFCEEVCRAFRRAVSARSEAAFLHQLLVWVIGLIAGREQI